MRTNLRATDEFECLMVASEANDPYAAVLINPKTGVSYWSCKGTELQGAPIGCFNKLGQNSDLFIVAVRNAPLVHIFSADGRRRCHVKSVLSKPVQHLTVMKDGTVLFAATNNQIYIWIVATGELVTVVDAHYRNITSLLLNSDDSLLISGTEDGSLSVFVVAEVMSAEGTLEKFSAFREWRPHSLAVSDISVTKHSNPRILSCSKDHTAAVYSVTANECLLKISSDVALLSCAIDPAECRIFLGTAEGSIAQLDLYASNKPELSVVIGTEKTDLPIFSGHSSAVIRLDVNFDGTLLASGDVSGSYVIWDILSQQCLKTLFLKGSICNLKFIPRLETVQDSGSRKETIRFSNLKQQKLQKPLGLVPLQGAKITEKDEFWIAKLDRVISDYADGKMHSKSSSGEDQYLQSTSIQDVRSTGSQESSSGETIESMKSKIVALEKANQQIYEFAASLVIDRN